MATTSGEYLRAATERLRQAGIETARLDVLVLLEDVLGRDRGALLAHPEATISPSQEVELNTKIAQRATHTPLAYIRGQAEFHGRTFLVNEHVLVPRPESEAIIELLKTLPLPNDPTIADIGCGSGCLGITAALELPRSQVLLVDIEPQALNVARRNAQKLGAHNAAFRQSDLLQAVDPADVLLANLPYVPDGYPINQAAQHEPALALFAGADGLDLYRRLWQQVAGLSAQRRPRWTITESLTSQHDQLKALAKAAGYRLLQTAGLIQVFAA